jgi:hypothetical protein
MNPTYIAQPRIPMCHIARRDAAELYSEKEAMLYDRRIEKGERLSFWIQQKGGQPGWRTSIRMIIFRGLQVLLSESQKTYTYGLKWGLSNTPRVRLTNVDNSACILCL